MLSNFWPTSEPAKKTRPLALNKRVPRMIASLYRADDWRERAGMPFAKQCGGPYIYKGCIFIADRDETEVIGPTGKKEVLALLIRVASQFAAGSAPTKALEFKHL